MRRRLVGSTALLTVGAFASGWAAPASAADGIKLGIGGFFKQAYQVVIDDDDEGELGNERNTDGLLQ